MLLADPASYIPASKLRALDAAVRAACDTQDGLKDGVLNDPRQCRFDPASMLCKGAETDSCLTPPQATALKGLYAGSHASDGSLVFPGYLPGAEDGPGGWGPWLTGTAPEKSAMFGFGYGYFANMVYNNAGWDFKTLTVDEGLKTARAKTGNSTDASDPNLQPFFSRGGKLVLYHGWNDPAISSLDSINYYDAVLAATGKSTAESSVRLYMVAGMQHCSGGPGADSFGQGSWNPGSSPEHDVYKSLEQWVEEGHAPKTLIATKYEGEGDSKRAVMTRPLCVYPELPKYKGSGDTANAASFTCAVPSR